MSEFESEIIVTDYEDFVVQLYWEIRKAAERNSGLELKLSPYDCYKWAKEEISYIECN